LLVAVSWRATPGKHDVAVILYIVAGALEAGGVLTTVADLHSKMKAARDFATPQLRAVSIREQIARNAAAARGAVSYGQVERINHPLLAALDGRVLRVAGSLLLLGIAVGTAANILSATA
jgi:hypothetical protein